MDFKWTWAERKTESTAHLSPLTGREGKGLLPSWEWAVCLLFGGHWQTKASVWFPARGGLAGKLVSGFGKPRAEPLPGWSWEEGKDKGRGPDLRWWRELFRHFFICNFFRVAGVVWSQGVRSGVNCLHGQENQFAIILQTAVFSELFLLAAIFIGKTAWISLLVKWPPHIYRWNQDGWGARVVTALLSGF